MSDSPEIKCAKCDAPLQATTELEPDTMMSCPVCGQGDTVENVRREIRDYVGQETARHLNRPLREFAARNKNFKFTEHPRPPRGVPLQG